MLTREIAQTIVLETSLRLNRNINIMDEKGIIIASCDPSRIDDIHEGALEVLKSGETLIIPFNEKGVWKGAHPGINLPIVFQDRIVGVIGITGNPEDIQEFSGIVKMITELMIKEKFIASQLEWKLRTKEMIIEELLKSSPSYSTIERGLNLIGLNLEAPFITHVIQMMDRAISNQTLTYKIEGMIGEKQCLVGFINTNRMFIAFSGFTQQEADKKLQNIYDELKKLKLKFRLAYSTSFKSMSKFNQSYIDCDLALQISDEAEDFISFADVEPKALIYKIDRAWGERFNTRIMNKTLLKYADTLEAFFKNNLNIQQTAEDLYLHRNTLIYRLSKIEQETGYDPKTFKDALTLQLALWTDKKLKSEELTN
ncbi:sugar diacid recognition domain-containing protein [Paenibacillus sp. BSR1-1]|uniref:CdaR family transcriptional regulator n=1 Tax=Paenibacillus sp. BSR1-1 TaxID=3020845 RepID=UPI0025B26D4B|nr:sugar diacid recognition domain-containing protein [Paenibacillus sp. BSR1-1]MDN3017936.1 sugar diacid recognition domain-containing protein [Paenibacillus sp. BSR1-1]